MIFLAVIYFSHTFFNWSFLKINWRLCYLSNFLWATSLLTKRDWPLLEEETCQFATIWFESVSSSVPALVPSASLFVTFKRLTTIIFFISYTIFYKINCYRISFFCKQSTSIDGWLKWGYDLTFSQFSFATAPMSNRWTS